MGAQQAGSISLLPLDCAFLKAHSFSPPARCRRPSEPAEPARGLAETARESAPCPADPRGQIRIVESTIRVVNPKVLPLVFAVGVGNYLALC